MTMCVCLFDARSCKLIGIVGKCRTEFIIRPSASVTLSKMKTLHYSANSPLYIFHNIGGAYTRAFQNLGIHTVRDLANCYPNLINTVWMKIYTIRGRMNFQMFISIVNQCREIVAHDRPKSPAPIPDNPPIKTHCAIAQSSPISSSSIAHQTHMSIEQTSMDNNIPTVSKLMQQYMRIHQMELQHHAQIKHIRELRAQVNKDMDHPTP